MEDSNSWLRRTKYSHTVCHRFDTSKLAAYLSEAGRSIPQSLPKPDFAPPRVYSPIQVNPVINKQRSVSPSPQTKVPDSFKEAKKSIKRRHSTPNPRRRNDEFSGKGIMNKWFHGKQEESSAKKKELGSAWTKKRGGKVNAVEDSEECCGGGGSCVVDMSKLFIGLRFAHGAHSRLYHGLYNDQPVAVKIIREPDDDENGALGVRLKNQFDREVSLLTRLSHPNVIKDDPGTYRWMAPEMIKKKSYSRKVDVYGFGLMLWEMVTGTIPYEEMNPIQAAFAVVNKVKPFFLSSPCLIRFICWIRFRMIRPLNQLL
ncbi:Serine/threonine-protein kinase STY13 [Linum perenne]